MRAHGDVVVRRMSASASGAACRVCGGGVGECACHGHGHGIGGARCGGVAVADLNRGFPGMWHQAEEEPGVVGGGGAAAAAGLQEFQFFGHDDDHESVTWLFNDPAPHLHRGPAPAAVGNGEADAEQRRAPPLFDGYAHAQYGQTTMPGHGLTFDVPLSRGDEVAAAAVLEAGLGLGGGGSHPATSSATIVSGSVPSLLIPSLFFLKKVPIPSNFKLLCMRFVFLLASC